MAYLPFIRLFKKGDPARLVGNVQDKNRLANIVNDLSGVGCRIEKPVNGEGRGWKVVVDGRVSDNELPPDWDPAWGPGSTPEPFRVKVNGDNTITIAAGNIYYRSEIDEIVIESLENDRAIDAFVFVRYVFSPINGKMEIIPQDLGDGTLHPVTVSNALPDTGYSLSGHFAYWLIAEIQDGQVASNSTGHIQLHDNTGRTACIGFGNVPKFLYHLFVADEKGEDDIPVYMDEDLTGDEPDQKIAHFVRRADLGDWPDLANPPVKFLGKDSEGNIGWVPIEDICGYCEGEWCPDLADEYALTYTNEVWIVDDDLKFFDGNPPPSPATLVRTGNSCEYTLVDSRTREFTKLHFDRSTCQTASDGGTTYTLKRDAGKTRWEIWEGNVLLGWNNNADAPDAGAWTANTTEAGGYAGTYIEDAAINTCGYTDDTAGIKVLTIGVS